ncbi:MAG: hypothetical protein WC900_06485, partial [Oscillospiraceae bacterium]
MGKMDEEVLCIPAGQYLGNFEKVVNRKGVFLVRKYAEHNFRFRHIIPYCVILIDNKILAYKRKKGNEPR